MRRSPENRSQASGPLLPASWLLRPSLLLRLLSLQLLLKLPAPENPLASVQEPQLSSPLRLPPRTGPRPHAGVLQELVGVEGVSMGLSMKGLS